MKKALIIGAAGFIGSHLSQRLKSEMELVCIDNLSNGSAKRFKLLNPDLNLINLDICKISINEITNIDYVFDLAYINGTKQFYTRGVDILRCASSNLFSSISIAKQNSAKLIYFSTPEVFGDTDLLPTPDDAPFSIPDIANPRWSYSIGKIYGESLLHNTHLSDSSFLFNIVRPNNAYGPYDRFHVIPDLFNLIRLNSGCLEIKGNPQSTRSYCFIHDMLEQIVAVAAVAPPGETYNLGNSAETSLHDLANEIVTTSGFAGEMIFSEAPRGSPDRRLPCTKKIDKICKIFKTPLRDGLYQVALASDYDPYIDF